MASHSQQQPTASYSGLTTKQRVARAVKILAGSYRADLFADAELFALQCAVLFEKFEIGVVEYLTNVTNPNCLQLVNKFPPSLQEIGVALEEETVRRERRRLTESQPKPSRYVPREIPNHPGCRCNLFVHADAPQYPALLEWSQRPDSDVRDYMADPHGRPGIWVALNVFTSFDTYRRATFKPITDAELRAMYGAAEAAAK